MKAMLFAAGLGTRLRPLTNDRPKALVEAGGKPLLQIHLEQLKRAGVSEVVVNVHHFADLMKNFIASRNWGFPVHISDETALLLDTGGGLMKAAPFFSGEKNILLLNVDILSNLDYAKLLLHHESTKALATLAIRHRETSRYFLFDDALRLRGWKNTSTREVKPPGLPDAGQLQPLAFSGIHILRTTALPLIRRTGVFSMTDVYLDLCTTHPITGYLHDDDFWMDVGKPEHLAEAERRMGEIF